MILPKFGLVCITASNQVRYRSVTRKRLLTLTLSEQQQILRELYHENLRRLERALQFCQSEMIPLYRLPSSLFPFSDEPFGREILEELATGLGQIGDRFRQANIRLVIHPDQFVVLNSDRDIVIENSIKILQNQAHVLDLLDQPRSAWTTIEIHGGKSDRAERLVATIAQLPAEIRSRLALENDEYAYSAAEILSICQAAGIPMVFDAHHHVIHEQLSSYDDVTVKQMLDLAQTTWPEPDWQLVHISNGRDKFADNTHSDFITEMPSAYQHAPWIEVEARQKEQAIAQLKQDVRHIWLS
uniref:UV-endonuclease UvdE n=1 Tax=Cyanothece sp. (strain PCC 7425 / ATCC 29141) TaxID=395961 RepID=B8HM00_CYAP4